MPRGAMNQIRGMLMNPILWFTVPNPEVIELILLQVKALHVSSGHPILADGSMVLLKQKLYLIEVYRLSKRLKHF
jgi:hypothetical protein